MKLTLLIIPLILLSSCSIDWNDEKDKKIAELEKQVTELKSDKELELQKFEFEKQKYEEQKKLKIESESKKVEESYRQECTKINEANIKNYENFIGKCMNYWGTADFCMNNEWWKLLWNQISNKNFIAECVEKKLSLND
jgi:hypothetical protein